MNKRLQSFGLTNMGMRRSNNEDAIYFNDDLALYIVADGMGGHSHGEVASAIAVETITRQRYTSIDNDDPFSIKTAIKEANNNIYRYSKEMIESQEASGTLMAGMGTTVVSIYIKDGMFEIAHVGDSRAYRMRNARLELLTRDHSLLEMAAKQQGGGFSIPIRSGFKNVITRALGIEPDVEIDLQRDLIVEDDLFLLCSDGLTNMVSDHRIEEILTIEQPLDIKCEMLISEANQNGGKDNISCILIHV